LVRKLAGQDPDQRFFQAVLSSPAFAPLRSKFGAGFEVFLRDRVAVLAGDATLPDFGLSADTKAALAGKLDLIVNVAGLVSLNPALDDSLEINAHGAR